MSFTHALSTNRYGEADLIVDSNPARGTHVTLASAIAAASSGNKIFIRTSVTENVTIDKSLTLVAFPLASQSGGASTVSITGKITVTTNSISVKFVGLQLVSNSDNILSLNATGTDIIYVDCNLSVTATTGFSVTGTGTNLYFKNCVGSAASGTVFYAATTTVVWFDYCRISGTASTTSTQDAGSTQIV